MRRMRSHYFSKFSAVFAARPVGDETDFDLGAEVDLNFGGEMQNGAYAPCAMHIRAARPANRLSADVACQ